MSEIRSSSIYAGIALGLGVTIGVIGATTYNGFLTPIVQAYLGLFGQERVPGLMQPWPAIFMLSISGILGAGAVFLTAQIDDEPSFGLILTIWILIGLSVFCMAPTAIVQGVSAFLTRQGLLNPTFVGALLGLLSLISMIPAVVCWFIFIPLNVSLFIAGLLCLPRLFIYHTTMHPLLTAWNKRQNQGDTGVTAADIEAALGDPARNPTQALKLKRDLERLEEDINKRQEELAAERAQLRSAILGDVERFETEKRLSKVLLELDALNTEVDAYRQYVQRKGKNSEGSISD